MIHAVQALGEELLSKEAKDPIEQLAQEPNAGGNYPAMLLVELESDSERPDNWLLRRVSSEETKTGKPAALYLYRRRGANGANYSPTSLITELEKTWNTRVLPWFSYAESVNRFFSEDTFRLLRSIHAALVKHTLQILEACSKHQEAAKHNFGITLKLDGQYIGERPEFREVFHRLVNEKDFEVYAENRHCSVCGAHGVNVIGNLNVFKFYTLDKPGYISGKFKESQAWRNYPVCLGCKHQIEEGKAYLQKHLSFSFYGLPYLIIPKWLFPTKEAGFLLKLIQNWKHKQTLADPTMKRRLTADEAEILDILSEEPNQLQFDLLFLKVEQSGAVERVLLHLEDIQTIRLKRLFDAKAEVENTFEHIGKPIYHFGKIRTFFAKSDTGKRNNDLDKYFLSIVSHCFIGKQMDDSFLYPHFMREIRARLYSEEQQYRSVALDAVLNLYFFGLIGILPTKEATCMREDVYSEVIRKYRTQLDQPVKEGLFLLGAMVQILLDIQRKHRGASPFEKQLKGLRMTRTDFMGLLNKTVEKLRAYDEYGPRMEELVAAISWRLLDNQGNWKMSVDEMNFYVAAGMALKSEIDQIRYRKEAL